MNLFTETRVVLHLNEDCRHVATGEDTTLITNRQYDVDPTLALAQSIVAPREMNFHKYRALIKSVSRTLRTLLNHMQASLNVSASDRCSSLENVTDGKAMSVRAESPSKFSMKSQTYTHLLLFLP